MEIKINTFEVCKTNKEFYIAYDDRKRIKK